MLVTLAELTADRVLTSFFVASLFTASQR